MSEQLEKTLAVTAICNGTVLDHIPAYQALKIARLLNLDKHRKQITIGLNLPSKSLSFKDIIKIEGRKLTPEEANQITLFAPDATINIIENYAVISKFQVAIPDAISNAFICPNSRCITNHEKTATRFFLSQQKSKTLLQCYHCSKSFTEDALHL